jgi:N6-adenosine-specific RNA methylase IME4
MVETASGYGVILADPPWDWKSWSKKGEKKSASQYYQVMEQGGLSGLPVASYAAPDCCLFIWVLNSMLDRGLQLVDAWGFTYKTVGFVWIKQNPSGHGFHMGLGYHTRQNAELCIIATKGKPKRMSGGVRQIIVSPRREHSRKPDELYGRIEELYPGPYLELFSRTNRKGWDSWGDQSGRWRA